MKEPIIPYGKQAIHDEDIAAVISVLKSEFLTQGPSVKVFESAFADYVGAKYAVAVANGTAALHLCALALDVSPGQKVITSPITFVASSNCVLYAGGDVEFADIDPKTYCLDPNRVEDLLKKKPGSFKGIIPVDFAGHPADLNAFHTLANKYNLWVIEDGCHAPGAQYVTSEGRFKVGNGNHSDLTIFSFHPVKHIACGEGGMITTNSEALYQKLQLLRTHGITKDPSRMTKPDGGWYYEMQELGFNYRMPDMLCALGTSQLKRADQSLNRRKEIAERYNSELKNLPIVLPATASNISHAYHLYVIQTERRLELYDFLKTKGIFSQVHYIPVHHHPYYVEKYGTQKFANADKFYERCLSIPMYHSLSVDDQSRVIDALKEFYA